MRWSTPNYELGDTRMVERFLLVPKRLQRRVGDSFVWETRWLESAVIIQTYETPIYDDRPYWQDLKWEGECGDSKET